MWLFQSLHLLSGLLVCDCVWQQRLAWDLWEYATWAECSPSRSFLLFFCWNALHTGLTMGALWRTKGPKRSLFSIVLFLLSYTAPSNFFFFFFFTLQPHCLESGCNTDTFALEWLSSSLNNCTTQLNTQLAIYQLGFKDLQKACMWGFFCFVFFLTGNAFEYMLLICN